MSISSPFIQRPVGTTLLTIAIALVGLVAYQFLPVSSLPQVEFPTISVSAGLPGASPETMASAVATPLERQFGRIAGVTEMTSNSTLGNTSITLQFDLDRNIDAAARDVQAAINAARGNLPSNLPRNPTYRKINPSDAPIVILALTSDLYTREAMFDVASTIVQQKISQVEGVGQAYASGGSPPAVRVDVSPALLNQLNISLDDVRATLFAANVNRPKGVLQSGSHSWTINATDQLLTADEYRPLIVSYRNGSAIRLGDVATVTDAVEDIRTAGVANNQNAVLLIVFRQPGANIIKTVDAIKELLPQLQAEIPAAMTLRITGDRTTSIRASVHDVQLTLMGSVVLVILVVFVFLRDWRSTLIPTVAIPVSLIGTFAIMYLFGYSIDNLSLMALTVATGFVVDDAIVVIENVTRHLEAGMSPVQAAYKGAREIGFTVFSISLSLVAVFIPILLMGGTVGRLFREFAVTLSAAIGVSMIVSLTTTPMMCAVLLRGHDEQRRGRLYRATEWFFDRTHDFYAWTLRRALRHRFITLLITLTTIGFTVYLYTIVPKGFFPQQDVGRLTGSLQADQSISFEAMEKLMRQYVAVVAADPAIENVVSTTGGVGSSGNTINTARMFIALKPLEERQVSADEIIARLRPKLAKIAGGTLFLQSIQDVRVGGRASASQYQYTLQGDDFNELTEWAPKVVARLRNIPGLLDVDVDQQNKGLQAGLTIDRVTAARFGISAKDVDDALYTAFGQRQVSTYYTQLNQYHVVMEIAPQFARDPQALSHIYVKARDGSQVPLSTLTRYETANTALSVNHSGQFPSVTISFNLAPRFSLGQAVDEILEATTEIGLPATIHGNFSGTAQAFQSSLASQPWLVLAAIVSVYIVLGILYESYVHPITILSTIPSAGVGALLALLLCQTELSVIALIGIILLIGIVKKNAIMMIDFALEAERHYRMEPEEAIFRASILRFRPITMTTMAALLGNVPLAIGGGMGAEFRRPLGIAIVGGLIFSQLLTLYTTPVVYLYLDRMRLWFSRTRHAMLSRGKPAEVSHA